jgi:hypothetical protein
MRIKDLREDEIVIGMRVKGLVSGICGTIIMIDENHDQLAWIQWDGEAQGTSGFYGNDCECEVVMNDLGQPEIRKIVQDKTGENDG